MKHKQMKENKVEVQKGKMVSNPLTMGQMTYGERVKEAAFESVARKRGQTTDFHMPKKGK